MFLLYNDYQISQRHLAHAAILLHDPQQCIFSGIRKPLLDLLLSLHAAETDYEFDAKTMEGLLDIREWSHLTARCAAKMMHDHCAPSIQVLNTT